MIVAGIGLRASATQADLEAALTLAQARPDRLATPEDKAAHPAFQDIGLPLCPVPLARLTAQATSDAYTVVAVFRVPDTRTSRFGS